MANMAKNTVNILTIIDVIMSAMASQVTNLTIVYSAQSNA